MLPGVFCAVYAALVALPSIGKPDFPEINIMELVRKMREHRRYMVQTKAQVGMVVIIKLHHH